MVGVSKSKEHAAVKSICQTNKLCRQIMQFRIKIFIYDELNAVISVNNGKCIIVEGFNGHVGSSADGYVGVHGDKGRGKGKGKIGRDGERLF